MRLPDRVKRLYAIMKIPALGLHCAEIISTVIHAFSITINHFSRQGSWGN
jgi:hypothetical protein